MQPQQPQIQTIIKKLQFLFLNKQLDEFIEIMEREILPYVEGPKHHQPKKCTQALIKQERLNKDNQQVKIKQKTASQKNKTEEPEQLKSQVKQLQQQSLKQQKQKINYCKQVVSALQSSKLKLIDIYQSSKLIISKMEHLTVKLEESISEQNQWKINKLNSKSKIAVRTKGTQVQVKFEGLLQASIENLVIMIYLIELYKECVPFCSGSKNCYEPSPLQKIALLDFKFPFLTERFAYFHGLAIDRLTKNGKLYIYAQGITKEQSMLTKIYGVPLADYKKKTQKSVPLDVKHALCQISKSGQEGQYLFKAYAFVDTHMPQLPSKAVNYIVKSMGGWVFDKILKKANNFKGSPWQKQMNDNEKRQKKDMFYKWLRQRVGKWGEQANQNKEFKKMIKMQQSRI